MRSGGVKFLIGGVLILAAVSFLIYSSIKSSSEYFMTIDELRARGSAMIGRNVRISGAVIGSTIEYNAQTMNLTFQIADVTNDNAQVTAEGGLAAVLHAAVTDPDRSRLSIVYQGPRPDLLNNEAQAIITGQLGADGDFHADELLLQCPSTYQQAVPSQVIGN